MNTQRLQLLIILVILVLAGLYLYKQETGQPIGTFTTPGAPILHLDDIPIKVEIVDTAETRAQGLSGRRDLGEVDGMLFVFDEPDYHGIWMKDMHFPIDVIWISENKRVIGVTKQLTPESFPRVYEPSEPALYAVETEVGLADSFGIRRGDPIELPLDLR